MGRSPARRPLTVSRCRPAPRSGSSWPPPARSQRSPLLPAPGPTAEPAAAPRNRRTNAAEASRRRPSPLPPAPPPDARKTSVWLTAPPACLKGKGGANPRSAQPSCPPLGSHDLSARRGCTCSATCWAGASRAVSGPPGPSPLPWVSYPLPPGQTVTAASTFFLFFLHFRRTLII